MGSTAGGKPGVAALSCAQELLSHVLWNLEVKRSLIRNYRAAQ